MPPAEAVLIGDTPADVTAGHVNGVRVIASATGRSGMDDLRQAGAETTLPNLADTEELLKLIAAP